MDAEPPPWTETMGHDPAAELARKLDAGTAATPLDDDELRQWMRTAEGDGPINLARPTLRRLIAMILHSRNFAFGDEQWPGLAKIVEEFGETSAEIGKLMMTHGDPQHWTGDVRERVLNEIADSEAAIVFFMRHNPTDEERRAMVRRITEKVNRFEGWREEQMLLPIQEEPLGFVDKMPGKPAGRMHSIHRSHRAEGNNFVD